MCRVLSYLGKPILMEELLYRPDNSLVKQSYNPQFMDYLLNLAGFGVMAWDPTSFHAQAPYSYKTAHLPFYDENLKNLADKITASCFLAHIRGVAYSEKNVVSDQNVHPFQFPGEKLVLAHNGSLAEFETMKYDLLEYIKPHYQQCIKGTTDSEWIYAILLSQFIDTHNINITDISNAIEKTLQILQKVRKKRKIAITSPINLFISNGEFIAATRVVLDYGWYPLGEISTHYAYHSLWYTYGEKYGLYGGEYKMKDNGSRSSIIIASEPLTLDTTTWIEVPEYSLIISWLKNNTVEIISKDLVL